MSTSESEGRLQQAIQSISDKVSEIKSLVDQAVSRLQQAGEAIDLTDELAALQNLQSDLQNSIDELRTAMQPEAQPPDTGTPVQPGDISAGASTGTTGDQTSTPDQPV